MIPIAHIENDFPTKFGIPRQSGRVGALKARIVFEPEYRNVDACRGHRLSARPDLGEM